MGMSDKPEFMVEVRGWPYDPVKWNEVAQQMRTLGNRFSQHFEGKAGYLFWETSDNIFRLMEHIDKVNHAESKGKILETVEDIHNI